MKPFFLFFLCHCFLRLNAQLTLPLVALKGVTIIDAHHHKPLPGQTIIIQNHIIADIFPDGRKKIPDSATVFNLQGKFVIPGMIDTHVHLATDPSGTDNREKTLNTLKAMLSRGITTVRDMAGDARTLASLARDANAGEIPAPDIYYSALMAGPSFFSDPRSMASTIGGKSGSMPYMASVSDSTDLKIAVAEAKGTGATGIKLYKDLSAGTVVRILAETQKTAHAGLGTCLFVSGKALRTGSRRGWFHLAQSAVGLREVEEDSRFMENRKTFRRILG